MKASTLRSDALLLLTAAIWGFGFVAQRMGMDDVGPFTYNGVRFALGCLSLTPLLPGSRHAAVGAVLPPAGRHLFLVGGAALGIVLFIAASLQVVAQRDAHPTHASILMSLEAVFAALGGWLLLDERMNLRGLLGCGLMLMGMVVSQVWGIKLRRSGGGGL